MMDVALLSYSCQEIIDSRTKVAQKMGTYPIFREIFLKREADAKYLFQEMF